MNKAIIFLALIAQIVQVSIQTACVWIVLGALKVFGGVVRALTALVEGLTTMLRGLVTLVYAIRLHPVPVVVIIFSVVGWTLRSLTLSTASRDHEGWIQSVGYLS